MLGVSRGRLSFVGAQELGDVLVIAIENASSGRHDRADPVRHSYMASNRTLPRLRGHRQSLDRKLIAILLSSFRQLVDVGQTSATTSIAKRTNHSRAISELLTEAYLTTHAIRLTELCLPTGSRLRVGVAMICSRLIDLSRDMAWERMGTRSGLSSQDHICLGFALPQITLHPSRISTPYLCRLAGQTASHETAATLEQVQRYRRYP